MCVIGNASIYIERYSDKDSEKTKHKAPLSHFIRMTDEYVPAELGEESDNHSQNIGWCIDLSGSYCVVFRFSLTTSCYLVK